MPPPDTWVRFFGRSTSDLGPEKYCWDLTSPLTFYQQ